MDSEAKIGFIFSDDFLNVIFRTVEEVERFNLQKIPNMLLVKLFFNDPFSTLRDYFSIMEIDLKFAERKMDEILAKCVEIQNVEIKIKKKDLTVNSINEKMTVFLKYCDFTTLLFAKDIVEKYENIIDENGFILALIKNNDKDFLDLLKELDPIHLKPKIVEMYFKGVKSDTFDVESTQTNIYS